MVRDNGQPLRACHTQVNLAASAEANTCKQRIDAPG
jgi:hypothetical protein